MKEALKMSLEMLKDNQHLVADNERHAYVMAYNRVIERCEEALANHIEDNLAMVAQQEQKPVAWISPKGNIHFDPYLDSAPLYTTPPPRTFVGLTDREKSNLWLESRAAIPRFHTYATLIEANLREKNT